MKYKLTLTKSFKKSAKKLSKDDKVLLIEVLDILANDEPLDAKYKDHALKGEWIGYRDLHIKPDLVLIYRKIENILVLEAVKVGKHSDVFKK